MNARGWLESLKPRSTSSKLLAAFLVLGILNLGVAAARGSWSWGGFGLLAAFVAVYALTLAGSAQKVSQTRLLISSLVGTWIGVALVLLLGVWLVLRATDDPDGGSGLAIGMAVLMGFWVLFGGAMAVLHTRRLLRLLRVAREQEDQADS